MSGFEVQRVVFKKDVNSKCSLFFQNAPNITQISTQKESWQFVAAALFLSPRASGQGAPKNLLKVYPEQSITLGAEHRPGRSNGGLGAADAHPKPSRSGGLKSFPKISSKVVPGS